MPTLEVLGLIGYENDKAFLKIPVLENSVYRDICQIIQRATEEIKAAIGEEFAAFMRSMKTPVPKHLTSVPELYLYSDAVKFIPMAIVREAYEKGLHLKDVASCCPPVVLVYKE